MRDGTCPKSVETAACHPRSQCLSQHSKSRKHPDKTYIGRIEKGFDFLGHHFQWVDQPNNLESNAKEQVAKNQKHGTPNTKKVVLQPAVKSIHKMLKKVTRLYEQGADISRIEQYLQR